MRDLSKDEIKARLGTVVEFVAVVDGRWRGRPIPYRGPAVRVLVREVDRSFVDLSLTEMRTKMIEHPCYLLGPKEEHFPRTISNGPGEIVLTCFDLAKHYVIWDPEDSTYHEGPHVERGGEWSSDPAKAFKYSTRPEAQFVAGELDAGGLCHFEVIEHMGGSDQ